MTTNMGSFLVCIDDGAELLVTVRQHWEKITPLSGISEWIPTTRSYKLANGYSLNSIDDDAFQIVETGKIVRRKR